MTRAALVAGRVAVVVAAMAVILIGTASSAYADNCGDLSDCSPSDLAALLLLGPLLLFGVFVSVVSSSNGPGAGGGSGSGAGDGSGTPSGSAPSPNKSPPAYDPNYVPPKADPTAQQKQQMDDALKRLGDKVGQPPENWIKDINPTGAEDNCVETAKATDQTLGGHPTVAGPVQRGQQAVEVENAYPDRPLNYTTPGGIEQDLLSAGPGSRGIVTVNENGYGHAFNAYNDNGTIKWIDGQTGKVATSPGPLLQGSPFDAQGSYRFVRTFP